MTRLALTAGAGLALALALACSHAEPDIATLTSNSDQVIWEAGQKALEKKNWESARQHFRRIIDGFPQSEYAPGARLALAETFVRQGDEANDIMAIAAYRDFLTLYPSHPKADDAQFQVAEAYFRQKSGPDRDQTETVHALEEYQRLLEIYPDSDSAEKARGRIRELRQSLARAEFMAGYFYQRTRVYCPAATARYEGILKQYPDFEALDEVLLRLAECLQLQNRVAEALPHLARILEEFPKSPFSGIARAHLLQWSAQVTGAPPVSPAPGASPEASAPPATAPTDEPSGAPSPLPSASPSASLSASSSVTLESAKKVLTSRSFSC